jgi:transposase
LDTRPIPAQSLENYYHIDGYRLERHYKEHLSDFKEWECATYAEDWLIFSDNIGSQISIDETSLSNGDLYTVVTNKAAKGKKGSLVALIAGTSSETVTEKLEKIPEVQREQVTEVTLDMAASMHKIVRRCFPNAIRVSDRSHAQKPAYDALQEMRIAHRWDATNEETEAMEEAKLTNKKYSDNSRSPRLAHH